MRFMVKYACMAAAAVAALAAPASADVKVKLQEVAGGLIHRWQWCRSPMVRPHGRDRAARPSADHRQYGGACCPSRSSTSQAKMVTQHHFFDERGLLGIAFHPNYRENGKFYLAYSAPIRSSELDRRLWWSHTNVVSEFQVSKTDPNKADPNTRARHLANRLAAVQSQRPLDRLRPRRHALPIHW